MRTGTLNSDSCDYLINRSLSKIKKKEFLMKLYILLHNVNTVLIQQLITLKC